MSVVCSEFVNYRTCLSYYKLLKQMFEELLKYVKGYKAITSEYYNKIKEFQIKSASKLTEPSGEFKNASWLDSSHITYLTSKIPLILKLQFDNIKLFILGIEEALKPIDEFIKEKTSKIEKCEKKYDEANKELIKKYIEIEKIKINYLNSMNKTEDIVNKYYDKCNNSSDDKNINNKGNKLKEYETQMKNSINSTKKIESDYLNIIDDLKKNEDVYINVTNECIKDIKDTTLDLSDKMKEIILYYFVSVKNSFKLPLCELDIILTDLSELNEKVVTEKIITDKFNKDNNFKHSIPTKYSLKILNDNDNDKNNVINENSDNNSRKDSLKKKIVIHKFDDGIEELSYFEDEVSFNIVNHMNNNFKLLDLGDIKLNNEEEKICTKNYITKIINNMMMTENEIVPLSNEDISKLKSLLTRHENRIIFLHKLNDYRASGQLEIKEEDYKLIGSFFLYIIDQFKKDNKDFHSIELVIILSQTYYTININNKEYLQNVIENEDIFKQKNFWEKYFEYVIQKEIIRNKKINTNENKENENQKMNNIILAQSLSLIGNMVEFGCEQKLIKDIIEPKLIQYKLTDNLKNTIYGEIQNKIVIRQNKGKDDNDVSNYILNDI